MSVVKNSVRAGAVVLPASIYLCGPQYRRCSKLQLPTAETFTGTLGSVLSYLSMN